MYLDGLDTQGGKANGDLYWDEGDSLGTNRTGKEEKREKGREEGREAKAGGKDSLRGRGQMRKESRRERVGTEMKEKKKEETSRKNIFTCVPRLTFFRSSWQRRILLRKILCIWSKCNSCTYSLHQE